MLSLQLSEVHDSCQMDQKQHIQSQSNKCEDKIIILNYRSIFILDPLPSKYQFIEELYINHNKIRYLNGIEQFKCLRILHIKYNYIDNFSELEKVTNKFFLHNLNVKGNPIEKNEHCNLFFLQKLGFKNLEVLNQEEFCEINQQQSAHNRSISPQQSKMIINQNKNNLNNTNNYGQITLKKLQGRDNQSNSILEEISTNQNKSIWEQQTLRPNRKTNTSCERSFYSYSRKDRGNVIDSNTINKENLNSSCCYNTLADKNLQKAYVKPFSLAQTQNNFYHKTMATPPRSPDNKQEQIATEHGVAQNSFQTKNEIIDKLVIETAKFQNLFLDQEGQKQERLKKTKQKKKNIFLDCLEDTVPNFYRKSPSNQNKILNKCKNNLLETSFCRNNEGSSAFQEVRQRENSQSRRCDTIQQQDFNNSLQIQQNPYNYNNFHSLKPGLSQQNNNNLQQQLLLQHHQYRAPLSQQTQSKNYSQILEQTSQYYNENKTNIIQQKQYDTNDGDMIDKHILTIDSDIEKLALVFYNKNLMNKSFRMLSEKRSKSMLKGKEFYQQRLVKRAFISFKQSINNNKSIDGNSEESELSFQNLNISNYQKDEPTPLPTQKDQKQTSLFEKAGNFAKKSLIIKTFLAWKQFTMCNQFKKLTIWKISKNMKEIININQYRKRSIDSQI